MPVVTLTTDFGAADGYAGAMKGVVLSLAPEAILVDITHEVPRHDIGAGALALVQAAPYFPPGSVHVAVVDPGVGSQRAELVVEAGGCTFIGPDNGVLSWAAPPPRRAFRIANPRFRRESPSPTFHGRDVFAVAAGCLAGGAPVQDVGPALPSIVELPALDGGPLTDACHGTVVHVDGFGNLITSLGRGSTAGRWTLLCAGRDFALTGGRSFSDVKPGTLVLYQGSSGRVEVALREGSAADLTGARAGAPFELRRVA
jgi:S-adenosylmethionine hydrolase